MGSTQPNPTHVGWVRLNFFLTHYGRLGKKIPLTRPNPTQPMHTLNISKQGLMQRSKEGQTGGIKQARHA